MAYLCSKIKLLNMKNTFLSLLLCMFSCSVCAQKAFKCSLVDNENKISLHLDLYEETVNVPGMDMFGPMNGYMNGNIYGIWMITSAKIQDERTAVIRLSNDLGSETQEGKLSVKNDSTYQLELQGGTVIKKVVNKKLVKIPQKLTFSPKK